MCNWSETCMLNQIKHDYAHCALAHITKPISSSRSEAVIFKLELLSCMRGASINPKISATITCKGRPTPRVIESSKYGTRGSTPRVIKSSKFEIIESEAAACTPHSAIITLPLDSVTKLVRRNRRCGWDGFSLLEAMLRIMIMQQKQEGATRVGLETVFLIVQ